MRIILNAVAVAVTVMATTALIPQAKADRVCRQECSGPVCTEKCVETTDRDRERITIEGRGERRGPVAKLVGIESGVVSGVFNLESSGVSASDWRPRHDEHYHEA